MKRLITGLAAVLFTVGAQAEGMQINKDLARAMVAQSMQSWQLADDVSMGVLFH